MSGLLRTLWEGLSNGLLMAWTVCWTLVLGFAVSAIVQAWVPRQRIQTALGGRGARPIALATALGAASSSCSYAAAAIAKSLLQKGASATSALAFQFASTNLVIELGAVMWVLLGWRFALAEIAGGLTLIAIMSLLLRVFVSERLEDEARRHALQADAAHQHRSAGSQLPLRRRVGSIEAWSDVAHNFRNDCSMLWKEIALGFLLAGFVGLLGNAFFDDLFIRGAPAPLRAVENVAVAPLIAIVSFVCSVGNVPVAAVLWSGGIGFGGVIAFIFADLIVLPIVLVYRKYYGSSFALRISALMFVTIVLAALLIGLLFGAIGLIPHARPSRSEVFEAVKVDYRLVANALALVVFAVLFALTARRGATDPACGMRVDRGKALRTEVAGEAHYFCSEGCLQAFAASRESPILGESPGHLHL